MDAENLFRQAGPHQGVHVTSVHFHLLAARRHLQPDDVAILSLRADEDT